MKFKWGSLCYDFVLRIFRVCVGCIGGIMWEELVNKLVLVFSGVYSSTFCGAI